MELFFLVPKVIAAQKYINFSRDEIERALTDENGEFEHEWEEVIEDDVHQEHFVTIKLNISCRTSLMIGWAISLKMHGIRIDGIDWHRTFTDPAGNKQRGWHRHEFDQKIKSANSLRVPTRVLDGATSRTDFLIRTLVEMKILLSAVDHGNYELFQSSAVTDSSSE